jgi:hypothetical protein
MADEFTGMNTSLLPLSISPIFFESGLSVVLPEGLCCYVSLSDLSGPFSTRKRPQKQEISIKWKCPHTVLLYVHQIDYRTLILIPQIPS